MTESGWVGLVVALGTLSGAVVAIGVVLVRALRGVRRMVHAFDLIERALHAIEGAPATATEPERPGLIEMVGELGAGQRRVLNGQQVLAADLSGLRVALERLDADLKAHIRDGHEPVSANHAGRPRRLR